MRVELLEILRKEVNPALGCTGPTSVSFAVSKAKDIVGGIPKEVTVIMDRDTYKNSIAVGIPGTKEKGLEMAAALGAIAGKSDLGLEVLNYVTKDDEKKALKMIDENHVDVQVD